MWVRIVGIVGGATAGWLAWDEGVSAVILAAVLVIGLTGRNLVLAFGEWWRNPEDVLNRALLESDPFEWGKFVQQHRDMRSGKVAAWIRVVRYYLWVCFLLNVATVGISGALAYLIRGLVLVVRGR